MEAPEILHEYSNHMEAEIAKGFLTSNGIEAIVHSDDCGGMAGGQTFIRGVKLIVPKNDIQRARQILKL